MNAEYALKLSKSPRVIVDAGSNIGLAAVFFANRYPEAKIIAVEPEPSNYDVLRRNVAPYPNVIPVCAAIWKDNESVCIVDPGTGKWGFQISAADGRNPEDRAGCVTGLAVGELMKRHSIERVDLLKLDIEGAEKEVFENCQSWIDRVDMIVVELHDRFRAGCSRSFYNATSEFRYEWHKGETTVMARNENVVGDVAGSAGTVSLPFRLETVSGSVL
ncbi:MAG TPA: FkbM family methyltransferase [Bryobacteraceae bacterium]|nr:FkbM family methyltransferase [Bryobacteraceae bacterium]